MNKKYKKLIIGIVLDLLGLIPIPFIDVIWAPFSAYMMTRMYKGKEGKVAAFITFIEEAFPISDFVPTFTIMWLYNYVYKNSEVEKIIEV